MANLDSLTPTQRNALVQLQGITNGGDLDSEVAILSSVGWDVQAAVQAIFDSQPVASSSSVTPHVNGTRPQRANDYKFEQMEFDDSHQSTNAPPRRVYQGIQRPGLNLVSLLTLPFTLSLNIVTSFITFVFRILRIPIPRFLGYIALGRGGSGTSSGRALLADDPAAVAERFLRQLEEETGALCVSRAAAVATEEGEASSSSSSKQTGAGKLLPDFWLGSYESALRAAQREARVLCVILMSEEHDDVPEFRRTVLTDPDFVRALTDNQFIVWGGDIRDREAYQTSLKLYATTYPFVAFVSLHPRPTPRAAGSGSSSTSQLSVLSRHEGPPNSITSAQTLTQHITSSIIPRVTPHLNRIKLEQKTRLQERELRRQQDQAFRDAERRDMERVMKKREEERAKLAEQERLRRIEEDRKIAVQKKVLWKRYARSALLPREQALSSSSAIRIGIRLPSGERLIRRFDPRDSLTSLYVFVDSQSISPEFTPDSDPPYPPEDYPAEPDSESWDFRLAVSYPRAEVDWEASRTIGEVPELRGGANLVVEPLKPVVEGSSSEEED